MILLDIDVKQAQEKAHTYFDDPANAGLTPEERYHEAMTILHNDLHERHRHNVWYTIKLVETYAEEINDHLQDEQGDRDELPCIKAKQALYRMLEIDPMLITSVMQDFNTRNHFAQELRNREGIQVSDGTLDFLMRMNARSSV